MPSLYRRRWRWRSCCWSPQPASAQPLHVWWKTEPTRSELGLTADQSHADRGHLPGKHRAAPEAKDELDRLEGKLSRLIETMADEGAGDAADRPRRGRPLGAEQDTHAHAAAHAPGAHADQRVKLNAAARPPGQEQRSSATQTRARRTPEGTSVRTARGTVQTSQLFDYSPIPEDSEMKSNGLKWLAPSACAAFVLAMASNAAAQNDHRGTHLRS